MPDFDINVLNDDKVVTQVVEHLGSKGFVVKPKADYDKSMEDFVKGLNHEDPRVAHILAPVVRGEREPLENFIKEITKKEKMVIEGKPERAFEYTKRALSERLTELEAEAKKGISSEQIVKDFDSYKQLTSEEKKTLTKEIEKLKGDLQKKDITFDVSTSIARLEGKFSNDERIKPLIPTHVESVRNKALEKNPQYRDLGNGKKVLVFIDENGSIQFKDGNPYTVDKFIEENLSPIIDQGKILTGLDGKPNPQNPAGFVIPETVKDQVTLDEHIQNTLKLDLSDAEVLKKRNEVIKSKNLPIKAQK